MVGMGTGESGRAMVRSRAHQLEMQEEEGEEVILPDELVERIFAMVPFPVVFKFRVLSKSWQARLSSVAPQDDDGQKRLALSFQRQISQRSSNWKTFCPISLSDNREDFVAFDRTSNTWLRIPLPSSLQQKLPVNAIPAKRVRRGSDLRMEGALLLLQVSRHELFVVNILTRSWKQLPPCPHEIHCGRTLLSRVFAMPNGHNFLQIYDSTSAAWSTRKLALPRNFSRWELAAILDGVLYLGTGPVFGQPVHPTRFYLNVLSIKIKEDDLGAETSDQDFNIVAQLDLTRKSLGSVNRVICNPNLLIIFLFLRSNVTGDHILQALHIDFVTGQLLRVTKCPVPCPPTIGQAPAANPIADCADIVATVKLDRSQVLTYNVQEDKWIWLHYSGLGHELARVTHHEPTIRSYFRPGLNPLAEV